MPIMMVGDERSVSARRDSVTIRQLHTSTMASGRWVRENSWLAGGGARVARAQGPLFQMLTRVCGQVAAVPDDEYAVGVGWSCAVPPNALLLINGGRASVS